MLESIVLLQVGNQGRSPHKIKISLSNIRVFVINDCHHIALLALELNGSIWFPDNIVLGGQELMVALSFIISINEHLFYSETDSAELDDIP